MWQTLLIVDNNIGGPLIVYIIKSFHNLKFGKESPNYNII